MKHTTTILTLIFILYSCSDNFLNEKPSTNIIVPSSLEDFRNLLDYTGFQVLNKTCALGQLASDDYEYVDYDSYRSVPTLTERNSYIWAKDIFGGEIDRLDWNSPWGTIFYANNVLKGLKAVDREVNPTLFDDTQGWALFVRAYAMYDLARNFSPAYDSQTADTDLGIPLRLQPEIDILLPRATVEQTYNQIIGDAKYAAELLGSDYQPTYKNRPSKSACFAFLARVYLSMNNYEQAEAYADNALSLYDKLMDYNDISTTSSTPFSNTNDELIFASNQVNDYITTATTSSNSYVTVNRELLSLYHPSDLRLLLYFGTSNTGHIFVKRGYYGSGLYPFSGLATDELFLIKAECLARRNTPKDAIAVLNHLLAHRYESNAFNPLQAIDAEEALATILNERRKELVWRGIRWSDLKRLNKIGANIVLRRQLGGEEFVLSPNDPKYVFPIPDDEITRSGITQNQR